MFPTMFLTERRFGSALQFFGALAQHLEEGHNVAVQVVQHLEITGWLLEQHARRSHEGLHVALVGRQMGNDPRGKAPLAAAVA